MDQTFNEREVFLDIVNFRPTKRTLKWEFGYTSLTVPRWHGEGLPKKDKKHPTREESIKYGQSFPLPFLYGDEYNIREHDDVSAFFHLDKGIMGIPVNYWISPPFEKKILFEDDKYIEYIDSVGIHQREYKNKSSMPLWLGFPVKNRGDWEKIKEERFDIDNISKRFNEKTSIDEFIDNAKKRTTPLALNHSPVGFFGSLRNLMGEERLLMMYYDDPGLIKGMLGHFCELWISIAEELTSKIDFDLAYFWEDMSYNKGPLISPGMFKEFMTPYYQKYVDFLHSKNIINILVDTDGKVEELIPLFLDVGVNMMYPFERQAGNDLIKIRKKYPKLVMFGGFDKNTLIKEKIDIDKELEIIRELIKSGGFIPHADHFIPHNASWQNFKYYRNKLNNIIDTNKVMIEKA